MIKPKYGYIHTVVMSMPNPLGLFTFNVQAVGKGTPSPWPIRTSKMTGSLKLILNSCKKLIQWY